MNEVARVEKCQACGLEGLVEANDARHFSVNGKTIQIDIKTRECTHCGALSTSSEQRLENQRRLKARKVAYGKTLMGEEVLGLRRKYGVSQQQAARLLGKGKIAFSRYETETSRPDLTTNKLLRLAIEREDVMKWLADDEAMTLPVVEMRVAEKRRSTLHLKYHDVLRFSEGSGSNTLQPRKVSAVIEGMPGFTLFPSKTNLASRTYLDSTFSNDQGHFDESAFGIDSLTRELES